MSNLYQTIELLSESDVEQKFVYTLLTTPYPEGLGYEPGDFKTKVDIRKLTIGKGANKKLYFPDYAIVIDGVPSVIIEVKAPGEDLIEAIREARLYATEINSAYSRNVNPCERIIATDGKSILGCYWDQDVPFVRLQVANLDSLDQTFTNFTDVFAKQSVRLRAKELLCSIKSTARYFKPVHMLGGKSVINEVVSDNSFGSNISIEYKYLFNPETLEDRASIVHNAYVGSKRKQAHVAPIDKIIRAAIPAHVTDARQIQDSGKPSEVIERVLNVGKVRNEICLLIGSVGSGKSTFTDYLRLEALPGVVSQHTEWINLNLNKAPLTRDLIYTWVIDQAIKEICTTNNKIDFNTLDVIKKIFCVELTRVEKGKASLYPKNSQKYIDAIYQEIERLQSDSVNTLRGMINFLYTSKNKLLVIVLDNCDKRNRDDQLLMFEVASWLKSELACMIFLPIRDTTYDQYRNEPPLDTVIKDLVFRIDPPLLEKVIYSRLSYAIREINSQKSKFVYYLPNNMKVECDRREVADYLKAMIASLFQDQLFKRIVTGLAGRNIRKGLEILLDFCKSGHIGSDEILKIRTTQGEYSLPNYMIAKILLKGKRKYYDDNESNIKNLFHSVAEDALPDPFVRIAILQWLKINKHTYGPNRTIGFHKVSTVNSDLQNAGHSAERVFEEIVQLTSADCIIAENQHSSISFDDLISISASGVIHLDLLKNVNYLATVAEDVLFRENQVAKGIADNLIGGGHFKVNSRQSTISTAEKLTSYMSAYHSNFFLGQAKVLQPSQDALLVINELAEYVKGLADNDLNYQKLHKLETDYPIGTKVDAQIVSLQDYGFFVEFGLNGTGLVHKSHFNGVTQEITDNLESGDYVTVEILSYNQTHQKFDLKLDSVSNI